MDRQDVAVTGLSRGHLGNRHWTATESPTAASSRQCSLPPPEASTDTHEVRPGRVPQESMQDDRAYTRVSGDGVIRCDGGAVVGLLI